MLACCAVVEFAQVVQMHLVYLSANATCMDFCTLCCTATSCGSNWITLNHWLTAKLSLFMPSRMLRKILFFVSSLHQSCCVCLQQGFSVIFPHSIHTLSQPWDATQTPMLNYTHDHVHSAYRWLSQSGETKLVLHVTHHESVVIIIIIIIIVIAVAAIVTLYTGVCHPPQSTAAAPNKSQHVCQRTQPWCRGVWAVCKVWVWCRCCKGLWDAHEGCKAARAALAALVWGHVATSWPTR